jgi:hypothetical protein
MTYYNDLNTGGATIDGNPESLALGPVQWQMVTGAQGSLTISGAVSTNIPGFAYTSYYLDDSTPLPVTQCTGDAFAYGSSGVFFDPPGDILCTDPGLNFNCPSGGPVYFLNATYNLYFAAPGMNVAGAQALHANAQSPLTVTTQNYRDPLGACIYDINDSGDVGFADLLVFAGAYNTMLGGPGYSAAADFNADNKVNFSDLLLFAAHYGWSTTACP